MRSVWAPSPATLSFAAVVYVGTGMAGPGHVRHHGGGDLAIGASPASEALAEMLAAAGIRTMIADDIETTLWSKLVINCAFNALSAVAGIAYGPMIEVEGARDVIASAVQEAVNVARASGVAMPDDLVAQILKIPAAMPNQTSSTAQDLSRGKPSEIDFLNGYVVRKGAELGIPTPTNQALQVMVKLAERGKALPATGLGRYIARIDPLDRVPDGDVAALDDARGDAAMAAHRVIAAGPERLLHPAARRAFAGAFEQRCADAKPPVLHASRLIPRITRLRRSSSGAISRRPRNAATAARSSAATSVTWRGPFRWVS